MLGKLLNRYTKNPVDIVKSVKDALHIVVIAANQPEREKLGRSHSISASALAKANAELNRKLETVRAVIVGGCTKEDSTGKLVTNTSNEYQVTSLTQELFQSNVMLMLVKHLPLLEFECRKLVIVVFNNMILRQCGDRVLAVDYLYKRPDIMIALLNGYEAKDPRVALNYGCMLRKCARYEELARQLMLKYSREFLKLFKYIELPVFDVASDAFLTFKKFLKRNQCVAAEFMRRYFDEFFNDYYRKLITSDNYVNCRQSLKLLSEMLLDRHNFSIMTRYIADVENLNLVMTLMTGRSRRIQYDAFHVFKVFVVNPNMPPGIHDVVFDSKELLIELLVNFQKNHNEYDEQFLEECAYVIFHIKQLKQREIKPPKKKRSVTLVLPSTSKKEPSKAVGGARPKEKTKASTEEVAILLKRHGFDDNERLCVEDLACALPMMRKHM